MSKTDREKFIEDHDVWSYGYELIMEYSEDYFDGYTMWTDEDVYEVYDEHFEEFVDQLMADPELAKEYNIDEAIKRNAESKENK